MTVGQPRGHAAAEGRPIWSGPPAWLYLPHLGIGSGQDLQPAAPSSSPSPSLHASADDMPKVAGTAGIRGRDASPGSRDAAAAATPPRAQEPRTVGCKAAERLAARNAGIAISLAHHAERVSIKDARGRRPLVQTPAERMAALRRRIGERHGPADVLDPLGSPLHRQDQLAQEASRVRGHDDQSVPASIEDDKIHQLHGSPRIRMTTASRPSYGHNVILLRESGGDERAGHGGGAWGSALLQCEGCSPPAGEVAAAVHAAAAQAAWHSNLSTATPAATAPQPSAADAAANQVAWHTAAAVGAAEQPPLDG